jgi:hypothetical protein
MARKLTEIDCVLIRDYLQANMAAALVFISADRADNLVSTEPPNEYFFFERSWNLRPPSVFIVSPKMDLRKSEKQANYISGKSRVNVTVVVEDQTGENLVFKAWRYQAALHQVLDQVELTSGDNTTKLVVVVNSVEMSPIYSSAKDVTSTEAVFRREVYLACDVEHYENF